MKNINIVITSVGRRTKLIEYFKMEFKNYGLVITTDCNELAPALYVGDKHYIVPTIDKENYIETIKEICLKENAKAIFSLIDNEIELLAKNAKYLKKYGINVISSSYNVSRLCFDKYSTYNFCINNAFSVPKTYASIDEYKKGSMHSFPVIVKPQFGSASINVRKIFDMKYLEAIFESEKGLLIQEFLSGNEYGVDVYRDFCSKEIASIFIKKKLNMRAGETDKAVSIKKQELFSIIKELIIKLDAYGPIDVDVIESNGYYYILDINPRFGGGYLLAYMCGCNFPKYILNNLINIENKVEIGNYEENVFMMKHDDIIIKTNY